MDAVAPLNSDKLAKLIALASSPNEAEALAALRKANGMLKSAGMSFVDVAEKVRAPATQPVQFERAAETPRDIFAGFNDWMEAKEPGWTAQRAEERAEEERKRAERRAAIMAKYGSIEAAVARDPKEQLLHDAVRRWLRGPNKPTSPEYAYLAGRWHNSMGGWHWIETGRKEPRKECCEALKAALPLPKTIRDAYEEYTYWCERGGEIRLVLDDMLGDEALDLPAVFRREQVRELLATGLRASNLDEVLIRQRYFVEEEMSMPEVKKAVLEDLEYLAGVGRADTVQNGQRSARSTSTTERRAEVLRLLSNVDTAGLSDREIARRVGVSPQTVGNLRRKHQL